MDYVVTNALCPAELIHHTRYTAMCVNYNDFEQVLHRHLHSESIITHSRSPSIYHELTALDGIKYDWELLQELIWACSPHINGIFQNWRASIHQLIYSVNTLILTYYHLVQDLLREILLSQDTTGMLYELIYHFVNIVCNNGDHGYISDSRCVSQHALSNAFAIYIP
jgi:hypothetical protein